MKNRKFLITVGAAISALIANASQAVIPPPPSNAGSAESERFTVPSKGANDPIVQRLTHSIGDEEHVLLMRKAASGLIYAQHYSHSSHGSHGSHGSHRSHRSGY